MASLKNDVRPLRLGVNIDHVATIRNARGGAHPDPIEAARLAAVAGADGITAHLREDRRHISDDDIRQLSSQIDLPLNLEMAATEEMLEIALRHTPNACCIVPEKRQELTTEGGLDVAAGHNHLAPYVGALRDGGIRVSLFVDPDPVQFAVAKTLGADIVELHAGAYCEAVLDGDEAQTVREFNRLRRGAEEAAALGLEVHVGHGLTYETTATVAGLADVEELNIGHFIIGQAIFEGLGPTIRRMRQVMDEGRAKLSPGKITGDRG